MPNYQNSKVYKIQNMLSNDPRECYVGSTCNRLSDRFSGHKGMWRQKKYDGMVIYAKFDEFGVDNFRIVLIEEFPCENKDQLRAREEHHRMLIQPYYNVNRAFRTEEDAKDYKKQWHDKNKEHIHQVHKQYREANRNTLNQKKREYYQNNKESINECRQQKLQCECGSEISINNRSRHLKTVKHQNYIKNNNIANQEVNTEA